MPTLISPCTFPTVSRSSLISAFSPPQPAPPRDRHSPSTIHARFIESPSGVMALSLNRFPARYNVHPQKSSCRWCEMVQEKSYRRYLCRYQILGMRKVLLIMRLPESTKSNDKGCSSQAPSDHEPQ